MASSPSAATTNNAGYSAQVLSDNTDAVMSFLAGKETVLQFLMGQVARLTKGKADPQVARQLLLQALQKKKES